MSVTNPLSIKQIVVEKLFGYYTYKIPVESSKDISRLLILYGDNGSGKTSILKILFWLLSSRNRSGFKSKIAKTKFQKICLKFENGVEVGAIRDKNKFIGDYTYYINQKSKPLFSILLKTDQDSEIDLEKDSKEDLIYKQMLEFLKKLNISVFYLSDDRSILNSITSSIYESDSFGTIILSDLDTKSPDDFERVVRKKNQKTDKTLVAPAIESLLDWIRTKIISGSLTGEKNSQVIFTDLIKNVLKPNEAIKQTKTKDELIKEVELTDSSLAPYIKLGLIEPFNSKTIKDSINQSKTNPQFKQLKMIIAPYIDSINAKLKALEKLKDTILLFVNSINDYFTNKELQFNLNTGFVLKQRSGDQINFDLLSSGEKQLLLLFINTITSADIATIFIIDEPEISLNIKWQRRLIDTLLKFSSDNNIQYILATHSLELLSSNIDNVTKLEDTNGLA